MTVRWVLLFQGVYYLITGIWPILHMSSFEAVTGEKTDDWLVQTVGALVIAIALTILRGARPAPSRETVVLSFTSIAAFIAVDVVFVMREIISPIYLLDAAAQLAIGVALVWGLSRPPSSPNSLATSS
jgi:hypothetical protein